MPYLNLLKKKTCVGFLNPLMHSLPFIWMKICCGIEDLTLCRTNQRSGICSWSKRGERMWFSLNRIYLRFKQTFLPWGIKLPFKCLFLNILHITKITFRWLKHMHGIIVYAFCHLIHFSSAVLYFETSLMSLDLGLAKMGNLNQGSHYFRRGFLAFNQRFNSF